MTARYEARYKNFMNPDIVYISSKDESELKRFIEDVAASPDMAGYGWYTDGDILKIDEDKHQVEYTLKIKLAEPITDSIEMEETDVLQDRRK